MTNDLEKNKNVQEDEISLKELILKIKEWLRYLWSKKWYIVATGILGGLLGIGYSYTKKTIYTATTTFVLESGDKGGGLGAYAGVASIVGIDLGEAGGGIFQGDNILDLYKSRKIIERALCSEVDTFTKQKLVHKYIEMHQLSKGWQTRSGFKELILHLGELNYKYKDQKEQRIRDSVMGRIVSSISSSYLNVSKPDKKLAKIKVDVNSADELFAKRLNEELVKNVNDFYVQTKTKKSLENVRILEHKTDSVRAVLNGAIYSSVAVADATPNINPTRQVQRLVPLQRSQFSAEANKAILGTLLQNLEISRMTLAKETPLIQVIDEPIYPLPKEKFSKFKGGLFGSLIAAFIAVLLIIICLIYKTIMKD